MNGAGGTERGPSPPAPAPLRVARRLGLVVLAAVFRFRRRRLLVAVWLQARWARSTVDCALSPDVRLGPRIGVTVRPRTHSRVTVAPHCALGADCLLSLGGGELVLGEWVTLRRQCQVEVVGRLVIAGPALVQRGTTLHCDESVHVGPRAVLSEYVTVVDSSHGRADPGRWFVDEVRSAPIVIGAEVWVGAKATVARGVALGQGCVVSANSLVVDDVPAGWLASGVPAAAVRRLSAENRPATAVGRSAGR